MLRKTSDISFTVNGKSEVVADVPEDMHLGHYLREVLGKTGTRIGCSIGECRACTVMVRHRPGEPPVTKQSCMIAMRHVNGWEVTTIEGIAQETLLHPVQQAILDEDAMQCGYCAAGFAVAGVVAYEQMAALPNQDPETVIEAVAGHNLCRCTGYTRYLKAIRRAIDERAPAPALANLALKLTEKQAVEQFDLLGLLEPNVEKGAVHNLRADFSLDAIETPLAFSLAASPAPARGYVPLFANPLLELTRLLRDAAEIEHSLLVQYLYAAFSVKCPEYLSLAGWASHRYGGRPLHVLGVAIEEMTHLDVVNGLLVELGAAPHLGRQQFPYEQDIYPFAFSLEALSLETLAKYVYVEAPADRIAPQQQDPADQAFVDQLYGVLGTARPNQVGSLYRKIEAVMGELRNREPDLIDFNLWLKKLEEVRIEGEAEHFELFKSIFLGTHSALPGSQVWAPGSPQYPSYALHVETGLPPAGEDVKDELLPALRHIGNLNYWAVCMLLDQSYRRRGRYHNASRRHMTGPLRSVASALALHGEGVPFDALPQGYAPGLDDRQNLALTLTMVREITQAEIRFSRFLPPDYSKRCALETVAELLVTL
ncbi:2Fe-2S iron-sulfur cluster binding domain-containing protein [Sphingomonas yunnanensis]|uniref:ferritin-like domain-containing protein n=1 Tax=Sphingomonas yunnanensis TaxID=310400 RepID=UPI001CA77E31|nr:2Fe-2S iron-sulfur cluster binding domain-containing protein [Sphingomonas yunnanensis]